MCAYNHSGSSTRVLLPVCSMGHFQYGVNLPCFSEVPDSPNCVFDASLVPGTCPARFLDLKGLINKLLESRVTRHGGVNEQPFKLGALMAWVTETVHIHVAENAGVAIETVRLA